MIVRISINEDKARRLKLSTTQKRLDAVKNRLVPPAVVPLLEVYTSDKRQWNANHRASAYTQLLEATLQAKSVEELRDWIMIQRRSGILVEAWFAFRCFHQTPHAILPQDDLAIAKLVIEEYVRGCTRFKSGVNEQD